MPQVPYTLEQAEDDISDLRGQVDKLNEILTLLNTGPTPNVISGTVELFNNSGQLNTINGVGQQWEVPGAALATFPGTAVTAASLTTISSATVLASDPDVGAIYELETWGNGVQGSTKQQLEFAVNYGGTTMADVVFGTTAFEAVSVIFRWRAVVRVICHTTGTSGTWTSYVLATISDFDGGGNLSPADTNSNFGTGIDCETTGTTAVSTTASKTLALQAGWASTTGGPSLTSRVAVFKRIN